MKTFLNKCKKEDLKYISKVLDSYVSLSHDRRRRELLRTIYAEDGSQAAENARNSLIKLIDKEIRYYGSSDLAYLGRTILDGSGGVSSTKLIDDVAQKLDVKTKLGGSVEAKLKRLAKNAVEKELISKTPHELAKSFSSIGIGLADKSLIIDHIKTDGSVYALPIIFRILGPEVTYNIIKSIIIGIMVQFIGRAAAKHIVRALVSRNALATSIGPVLWTLSTGWLVIDMQRPAYRKIVPIILYLGVVALREEQEQLSSSLDGSTEPSLELVKSAG